MGGGLNLKPQTTKQKRRYRGKIQEVISKLSQGLMMPIAVLPLAGLLLGIGSAIPDTNQPLGLIIFRAFIVNSGQFVFSNLAILFAVAIAIAFTRDAGVAALAAVVAWACFNGMQSAMIIASPADANGIITYQMLYWKDLPSAAFGDNIGINSLQTSVFGGIVVGAIVASIYNKCYQIQLPKVLGFFSGTRFVPIACLLAMMPLSLLFAMIYPGISLLLSIIGTGLGTLGANGGFNALIFAYINRCLGAFGLHHAFYTPLWLSAAGGTMVGTSGIANMQTLSAAIMTYADQSPHYVTGVIVNNTPTMLTTTTNGTTSYPTWAVVIATLNPKAPSNFLAPENWSGDQNLWRQINAYLAGKQVVLDNNETYTLTMQTFAQNTMNNFAPGALGATGIAWDVANNHVAFPGVNPGQYMQGNYPVMIFGLPAAALAMMYAAPKENRAQAGSILLSAAFTSFLTGITEPLEFTFLFLAPWLYFGVHAFYNGVAYWLMSLLGANVGVSFSAGMLDLIVYGFLTDAQHKMTNSYWVIVIGLVYVPLYFGTFYGLIKKFDLKTPGRGGKLVTKKEYLAAKENAATLNLTPTQLKAAHLIAAYGGASNFKAVNACITKLRVEVHDMNKVNRAAIMAEGAPGVIQQSSSMIHAVFGTEAEPIKTQMKRILAGELQVDLNALAPTEQVDNLPKAQNLPIKKTPVSRPSAPVVNKPVRAPIGNQTANKAPVAPQRALSSIIINAPISGIVRDLKSVPDTTFSDKLMGEGIAIEPTGNAVYSPTNKPADLQVAFPGGHAYVVNVSGIPVLIHLGIDTVGINANVQSVSEYTIFHPVAKQGTKLAGNALIARVDVNGIKAKNLNPITPVIVMTEALSKYRVVSLIKPGTKVQAGMALLRLVPLQSSTK